MSKPAQKTAVESVESQARRLRDLVYGKSTDHNWEHCKQHWMEPDELLWLKRTVGERN